MYEIYSLRRNTVKPLYLSVGYPVPVIIIVLQVRDTVVVIIRVVNVVPGVANTGRGENVGV